MIRTTGALLILSIYMIACSTDQIVQHPALQHRDSSASMTIKEYRLGIDDQLQVNVWNNPELSIEMPVRPDGRISMPLIGDVKAGGRTPEDVASEIKNRLSKYVKSPHVTVILTELRNYEYISRVRVTGAVETPSSFTYRQGMTVLDAILEAGSINEFAAPDRAKLYRRINNKTHVIDIKLGGILNQGELSTNYLLKPGDIITVPERFF